MNSFIKLSAALFIFSFCSSAQASLITTTFSSGSNESRLGEMFHIDVLGNPILITQIDINLRRSATVNIWTREGPFADYVNNAEGWTQRFSGFITASTEGEPYRSGRPSGKNAPTIVDLDDFILGPGSYSFAIVLPFITPGSWIHFSAGDEFNSIYSENDDIAIREGYSLVHGPLEGAANDGLIDGRIIAIRSPTSGLFEATVWNGTIHYEVPEPTSLALMGLALAGLGFKRRRK